MAADPLETLKSALADRYAVERELGRGGMSVVYLAYDRAQDRKVALKVLRPEVVQVIHRGRTARFLQEIQIVAKLVHPNILPLFESGELSGVLYYAMPYVGGESLRQKLHREKQLPLQEALAIAREVAAALDYAHREGVVHLDIKPENILLVEGKPVVMDFGIARAWAMADGPPDPDGLIIGTAPYMSPEQTTGSDVDERSDIYALGCVLYEMLAGHPPFSGRTTQEIFARHTLDPVPALGAARAGLPPGIEAAIKRALAKQKVDRFPSAAAFAGALADSRATRSLGRKTKYAVFAAAGVAIAAATLVGVPRVLARASALRRSVAVKPFVNLSSDTLDVMFSEGVSEEIMNDLGRVEGVRPVRVPASYLASHGGDVTPQLLGSELKVGKILEGSVRRDGNTLRVTARLVNAADNTQEWSEIYTRERKDIFVVEQDISAAIVSQLRVKLRVGSSNLARGRTDNLDAYELYLKGRYFYGRRTQEGWRKATDYFKAAVAEDSNYALAYSGLADMQLQLVLQSLLPADSVRAEITAAATRAVALDSSLGEVRASMARVHGFLDRDWPAADREFRRAIALSPGYALAHAWYGQALVYHGRTSQGVREAIEASRLDPLSPAIAQLAGLILYNARHYEQAIEQEKKSLELEPATVVPHQWLGQIYLAQGRYPEAIAELEQNVGALGMQGRGPQNLARLASAYALAGTRGRAREIRNQLERLPNPSVMTMAILYTGLGEKDTALAWLEQWAERPGTGMMMLGTDPTWDPLRGDPRFQQILKRLNLDQ